VRLNGTLKIRGSEEAHIELQDEMSLSSLLKQACKQLGCKDNYKISKLYNKNGIQLFQEDMCLLAGGDILYLAAKGKAHVDHPTQARTSILVPFSMTTRLLRNWDRAASAKSCWAGTKRRRRKLPSSSWTSLRAVSSFYLSPFSSIHGEHDTEHLQGGRIPEEAAAQEHHPALPRLRGAEAADHDNGVRGRGRAL
jgi:hypothetical protein